MGCVRSVGSHLRFFGFEGSNENQVPSWKNERYWDGVSTRLEWNWILKSKWNWNEIGLKEIGSWKDTISDSGHGLIGVIFSKKRRRWVWPWSASVGHYAITLMNTNEIFINKLWISLFSKIQRRSMKTNPKVSILIQLFCISWSCQPIPLGCTELRIDLKPKAPKERFGNPTCGLIHLSEQDALHLGPPKRKER